MNYVKQAVGYLQSHWVTVLALSTAVWAYAKPTVLNFVTNHPQYSFWFGLVATIVTFYIKSPLSASSAPALKS